MTYNFSIFLGRNKWINNLSLWHAKYVGQKNNRIVDA